MKEPGEAIKIIKRLIASIEGVYKSNPLTEKKPQPVIDALIFAVAVLEKQEQDRWIPVMERLPEKEGWYITTVENEKTGKRRIENDLFAIDIAVAHGHTPRKFCKDGYRRKTIAWRLFPEPYMEEKA